MIQHAELVKPADRLESLIRETNELISIFVASVRTTQIANRRTREKRTAERERSEPQNRRTREKRTAEPQNIEYRTAEVGRGEPQNRRILNIEPQK
jgi:hypothetical protein